MRNYENKINAVRQPHLPSQRVIDLDMFVAQIKTIAVSEDRAHDLRIMRPTCYQLRYCHACTMCWSWETQRARAAAAQLVACWLLSRGS